MSMAMTDYEIRQSYRTAKCKVRQIRILAQLNDTHTNAIRAILGLPLAARTVYYNSCASDRAADNPRLTRDQIIEVVTKHAEMTAQGMTPPEIAEALEIELKSLAWYVGRYDKSGHRRRKHA